MVEELLLGDNPFIGVSHLSHEKAVETLKDLTTEKKIEVIETAIKHGATGFTFSTHESNLKLLQHLKDFRPTLLKRMNYYILVPYAVKYVREATKVGVPEMIKRNLFSRVGLDIIPSFIFQSPAIIIRSFINAELRDYMRILPLGNVKAILLHEVLTELVVAFNLSGLVKEIQGYFHKKGISFGLETRNIKHLKEFLLKNNLQVDYIMTPLNPLGYQMTPNLREALESLIELASKNVEIIAMNTLASGAIDAHYAVEFLSKYKRHIYAIAVGTSKPYRAREIFELLSSLKS